MSPVTSGSTGTGQLTDDERALLARATQDPTAVSKYDRGRLRALRRWATPAEQDAFDAFLGQPVKKEGAA